MNRMYDKRKANIAVYRGCDFKCLYCNFSKMLKLSSCLMCRSFKPHSHMEVLSRTPPRTKEGEFLTIGLSGDISFMDVNNLYDVLDYCSKWGDRTFLIQSKNPAYFLQFAHRITSNVIIGTTIETNRLQIWIPSTAPRFIDNMNYLSISNAPRPYLRTTAMVELKCRKAVTIEPIMDFDESEMLYWMKRINPEIVWIGYDSGDHKLPEPPWNKTQALIGELMASGIDVREKLLRKAWYEGT